ncbi:MAG: hypothetical protein GY851_14815 [bacterium]|nr:hypothetical protein [bacterium]
MTCNRRKPGGRILPGIARRRAVLLIAVTWLLSASADTGAQPTAWSLENGWLAGTCEGKPVTSACEDPAVNVTVDDTPLLSNGEACELTRESDGSLVAVYDTPRGRLTDRYAPFPELGPNAWMRSLTYTNTSDASQDLCSATMRVRPVRPETGCDWNPRYFWFGETTAGPAVCVSYHSVTDSYGLSIDGEGRPGHRVTARWRLAPGQEAVVGRQGIWLARADAEAYREEVQRWYEAVGIRVPAVPDWLPGAILYEVNAGGHVDARFSNVGGFDRLARQIPYLADLGVTAVWLQGVHEHKVGPDPVKGGWNLYGPRDFSRVDAILGGPDALKRLTEAFRDSGIHVIGEIVPHGWLSKQATELKDWWTVRRDGELQRNWGGSGMDYASPEWQSVMRDAVAMLAVEYGMEGARIDVADGSGPNWGSPRTNHASYSTRGGSLEMLRAIREGLSLGVADPVLIPESWNTPEMFGEAAVGYGHAGWFLYGRDLPHLRSEPAELVRTLRDFYETDRGSHPKGARILRTLNNHDTVVHFGRIQHRYGAGLARALYGVCLMTPGVPMMYQEEEIGNYEAIRRLNWARRCVPEFVDGEADYLSVDAGDTVFACLRSMGERHALGLSNLSGERVSRSIALPEDVAATCDRAYDAVSGRRAPVRDGAFEWTLEPYGTALLRLGMEPVEMRLARAYGGEVPSVDAAASAFSATMAEDRVLIRAGTLVAELAAGPGPWTPIDSELSLYRSPYGTVSWKSAVDRFEFSVTLDESATNCWPELRVFNADRWLVSGRTALLDDRVMRRHFRFPAEADYAWDKSMAWGPWPHHELYDHCAPTGRLWESVVEPLHPECPTVAFQDGDGVGLVVDGIASSARHLLLTDRCGEEGPPEPYGLALRFYGRDPDLAPRTATFGMGQPWSMDTYPAESQGAQTLAFSLYLAENGDIRKALDAPRLPVPVGVSEKREGGQFNAAHDATWYVDPGVVTWSGLAAVQGRYRIRLELRHSEVSETGTDLDDAYVVTLDGVELALEWVTRNTFNTGNAYFGHALTAPVDLSDGPHTLGIATKKTWCAMRGGFHLVAAE